MEPKVTYWDNGQVEFESYYINSELHRIDGPAYTNWYENGNKEFEAYYINDELHRINGPAITRWDENGQKYYEAYYINNKEYSKEDFEASWEHQSYLFDLEVAENF